MKKSLLPLFSTGMNLECRDSKCLAGIRLGKQNAVTLGRKIQILRTKNILRIQMSLLCFFKCTAYSYFFLPGYFSLLSTYLPLTITNHVLVVKMQSGISNTYLGI